jgi:hypothetical protein
MRLGQQRHVDCAATCRDVIEADLVAQDGFSRAGPARDEVNASASKPAL